MTPRKVSEERAATFYRPLDSLQDGTIMFHWNVGNDVETARRQATQDSYLQWKLRMSFI
jgi:hypothetical protein